MEGELPLGAYIRSNVSELLDKIGFTDGLLIETICSTENSDGSIHSAPIGVRRSGDLLFIDKLFKDTTTFENLVERKHALINLLDDVEIFYLATFSDLPEEEYDKSYNMRIPPLKRSDAFIEAKFMNFDDKGEFISAELSIGGILIRRMRPCFFTRCKHAVLESLIHATRVPVFRRMDLREAEKLTKLILHYRELVSRICPEEPYKRIMRDIISRLHQDTDEQVVL